MADVTARRVRGPGGRGEAGAPAKREEAAPDSESAARPRTLTWKKDPGGRRERVLAEAARLFSERGYASVSAGEIARAAGVAEGSVFHYFGSKSDLLRAVGARYGSEFAAAMFSGVAPVPTRATIERVVTQAFEFVARTWPGFGLFLLSEDRTSEPLAHKANRLAVTKAVEAVLEQWMAEKALEPLDAPVVSELLFGLVEAALRARFTEGDASSHRRYVEQTVLAVSRVLGIPDGR